MMLPVHAQSSRQQLNTIIVDPGHGFPDPGAEGKYSCEANIVLAIAKKLVKKIQDSLPGIKVLITRSDQNLPGGLHDKDLANRWRAKFANENHGDLFVCIHANDAPPDHHSRIVDYRTRVYYTGKGKSRKRHVRKTPIYHRWTTPSSAEGTETYVWAVNKNDDKQQFIQRNQDSAELYGEEKDSTLPDMTTEEKIMASIRTRKYFSRSLLLANLIQDGYKQQGRKIHAYVGNGVKQRNDKGIWVLQATAMPSILSEVGFISNPHEEDYMNSQSGQEQIASALFQAIVAYKNQVDKGLIH
ncbi:hypothetical protein A9P82_09755 [Arachidicoccus ginsenosidimutans]|nr:hypothetical protein A9P82_09755 [Arachidicoccus sp. BS20]